MAIVYVEITCANPECRADVGYGNAFNDDGTNKPCPYCGCEENHRSVHYDG